MAATTGCRRGELCGLRWSDVDLVASTIVVRRSISDAGGVVSVKGTKTHQARRLALDPSTVEVFHRQRLRDEERAQAADVALSADAYVWSQTLDASAPYRPDRVTGIFRNLTDRLDMPHVTFHTLRHFAATTLAGTGVAVRTIAGRLGHANPNLTLRTYAHFLEAADRDAALAIHGVTQQLDALGVDDVEMTGAALQAVGSLELTAADSNRSRATRGTTIRRPRRTAGSSPRATSS
ncbi:MAG: site-specific integrase [Acidimicrobiales bacterium]